MPLPHGVLCVVVSLDMQLLGAPGLVGCGWAIVVEVWQKYQGDRDHDDKQQARKGLDHSIAPLTLDVAPWLRAHAS